MTAPRISVVIVNWNGGEEAVHDVAATAALAESRGDVEIVVVDNASSDGSAGKLAALSGVRVLRQPANLGFGPGSNLGVAATSAPLVLLLNPDAVPPSGHDPFAPLLAAADSRPAIDGFAPRLEDAPGPSHREAQERFQFRRLPTAASLARDFLLIDRIFPANAALRHARYFDVDRSVPFEVEQPAAAALLLRRSAWEAVGGFDPRFVPAWWEDVDLCARLSAAGSRLLAIPEARFVHRGGSSVSDEPGRLTESEYRKIFGRNLLRYAAKHWGGASVPLVRLLLLAGGSLRLLASLVGAGDHRSRSSRISASCGTVVSAFLGTGARK